MLIDFVNGQAGVVLRVKARQDNTGAKPGQGFTGLTNASTGLVVSTICDVEATPTVYTSAGSTIDTIATLGTFAAPTANHCRLKKVNDTNHPGLVELQLDNARYAVANAKELTITISGVSGLADCDVKIPLRVVNPYNANFGLTNLDAAISTRSTYAGADTSGTTTLLARLTSGRATNLDSLDAAISGVPASVWANATRTLSAFAFSVTVGTNSDKAGYSLSQAFPTNFASLAITGGGAVTVGTNNDKTGYSINLSQTGLTFRPLDSVADASLTVGDALVAAICGAAGKETSDLTSNYVVKSPFTGTIIRTFALTVDGQGNPTARS